LLALLFLLGAVTMVFGLVARSEDKVTTLAGYGFLRVTTDSMSPGLPSGSMIITKNVDESTIKENDIICFYSRDPSIEGRPNTHRVITVTELDGRLAFITKGDNNENADSYPVFAGGEVIGLVVKSFSSANKVFAVLQSQYFFLFAIVLPLCFIIFLEARNVSKLSKERRAEESKENHSDEE